MTFNQINYFLNVAKHLSFTKAASSLFITQSTLSRSIASLEDELGVVLLKRDFHNLSLTPAGELFYQEMDGIMESVQDILMRVQDLSSNQTSFSQLAYWMARKSKQIFCSRCEICPIFIPSIT